MAIGFLESCSISLSLRSANSQAQNIKQLKQGLTALPAYFFLCLKQNGPAEAGPLKLILVKNRLIYFAPVIFYICGFH